MWLRGLEFEPCGNMERVMVLSLLNPEVHNEPNFNKEKKEV